MATQTSSVLDYTEPRESAASQPNRRLGKYELLDLLGGGMSQVFRARDTVLGRTVVVKILTDAACAQPEAKARFLAEARLASNLEHDNVLGIYDFGEDEWRRPYMVMEFLRGQDLRTAIRNGEITDLNSKLRIALQAARALEYIHSKKVIHRDVKPENIYITANGVVKLMDFGIAKTEGLAMTRAGFVLGTPSYMAPEQVKGLPLTEQADVYSFGVLLFELLTGVKPIAGDTVERIFYIILNEPLDLTPLAAANAPEPMRKLVAQCTAKDSAERPRGFAPICAVLEQLLGAGTEPAAAPAAASVPHPVRRFLAVTALAVTGLVATAFGLAWFGYHSLEAKLRASADAISAAGIGADGLIQPEALRQFDNLRADLEVVERYHRNGGPIGYRLGELLWGDLYQPGRSLYFERFRTLFLGPVHNNQLQFLTALAATPAKPYAAVYETLKAYLMTTSEPARCDRKFLVPAMLHWWSLGLTVNAARESAAQRQFEFYADELLRDDPYSKDDEGAAVSQARRYLSQFAGSDRVYALVLEEAGKHAAAAGFNSQLPESEQALTDSYEVPGAFTKAGWDFVHDAISHPERYFAGESWVSGASSSSGAGDARQADELTSRYRAGFVEAWRQYLQSAALPRFASLRDAQQKLGQLAGDNSPLDRWLSLAAQNTAVDAPAVAAIFQPVAAAQSGIERYRQLLASLSASLGSATGDNAAALAIAQQAMQAAKQIEASFHNDTDVHTGALVARIIEEPITAARNVLRAGGSADWNAKSAGLYAQIKPVMNKFPFAPAAAGQASAQEIASVFAPKSGALWEFYNSSLQKLIVRKGSHFAANPASGLSVNPAFLQFLERAAAFTDAAFAGGSPLPKFRYMLRPVLSPDMDSVKLSIDGQSVTFKGNAAAKTFTWTGAAAPEMHLTVKFKNKTEYTWDKAAAWAMLMFFDGATRRQGAQMEIPLVPASSLWFEVTATPPIFGRGYFTALSGVAEVVKP